MKGLIGLESRSANLPRDESIPRRRRGLLTIGSDGALLKLLLNVSTIGTLILVACAYAVGRWSCVFLSLAAYA